MDTTPLRKIVQVPVDRLELDPLNPRLTTSDADASDGEIIARLYREEALSELLQSITANGYLDIEPLIVVEEEGRMVVLEGNRRLAAIHLLRDPGLVARIGETERLRITPPELPERHGETLERVSVYRVDSRADARSFIGFKHINGAAKWDSYAKAKFAAHWHRDGGVSLSDLAARIGDKHDTVKRMVNAIHVLEQAKNAQVFSVEDRFAPRFNFSHLYTALSRKSYVEFLGLEAAWSRHDPTTAPVPADKVDRLAEVMRWIYGSKANDLEPVVQSQNPDVKMLGEVLENADGLSRCFGRGRTLAMPSATCADSTATTGRCCTSSRTFASTPRQFGIGCRGRSARHRRAASDARTLPLVRRVRGHKAPEPRAFPRTTSS